VGAAKSIVGSWTRVSVNVMGRVRIRGNTCSFRDAIANIGVVSLILTVIQTHPGAHSFSHLLC